MPTRRLYEGRTEGTERRPDVDQAARTLLIKKLVLTLPGGVVGGLAGWFAGFGALFGFLIGAVLVFVLTTAAEQGAASLIGRIYHPRSETTPRRKEYSYAESLAARGRYDDAIEAYEVALSEFPEEPEPYLRIARIYRDRMGDYDNAIFWFKRARTDAVAHSGTELLATREIVELYTSLMGQPTRAIPELARLAERFADQPAGVWATQELARLREVSDAAD